AKIVKPLPDEPEPPLRIVLAQGVSRGEKMDYTLQKSVELGVSAIQPLLTDYGGIGLSDERWLKKVQHWRGVIIGACEQCGRNRLPELRDPATLSDWLNRSSEAGSRWLLDPLAEAGLRELDAPNGRATLLIGPEGGLSVEEIQRARAAGFVGVRLGPRVLRTETAGVAALAAVQTLWGDWR
ncbi:MAG: 16S rRNA (uracil(1498)-N(3))-methyltransferase, partial [Candidatus Competibacteraceae bacterium]|nr:16S rRNA (uracil(1498)-N(3))-methyltransferase [Candidatus Competibacteraceae bacterium]